MKLHRKLRILHVIPNLGTGGAERLLVNLVEAFDRDRFDIAVSSLYSKEGTVFEEQLEKNGIHVYYLGKHKGLDLRMIPRLCRIFRDFRPDIVHTHLSVLRYALIPLIVCNIPVRVHTVHNIANKEVDTLGKIVHYVAFHFGKVIPVSISERVARTVRDLYKVKTPIIYNGIPINQFQWSKETRINSRRIEEIDDSEVVFLHIGRFSLQKNHHFLIQSFEAVVEKFSYVKLLLAGEGEFRSEIIKIVEEKKLNQNIRFLGLREDIPELLSASDVFVLSSDWEGLPMTVLEAMAAGKPVIATAVGGVPELVEDEVTGLLVPPRNVEALSRAMILLAKDPVLRESMGKNGQMRVKNFDINLIAKKYENLYLQALRHKM